MSTKSNGYNGSTDFEKWYKETYGRAYDPNVGLVRGENMSDGDWSVGSILHNYYLQDKKNEAERKNNEADINKRYDSITNTVRSDYASSREALNDSKAVSQQNAGVMYDRLMKYLPMKMKSQGLSGIGTAQSELDAYNAYSSRMGEISAAHQNGMAELDSAERASIGDIESARMSDLSANSQFYDSIAREGRNAAYTESRDAWDKYVAAEEAREKEDIELDRENEYYKTERANEAYANMTQYINSDNYSADELQGLYSELEKDLTSAQRLELSTKITEQKKHEDTVNRYLDNAKKVNAKITTLSLAKTAAMVDMDGKEYQVFTTKVDDLEVIDLAQYIPRDMMFGYNGKVYARIGEDVYELENGQVKAFDNWNSISLRLNGGKSTPKTWTEYGGTQR